MNCEDVELALVVGEPLETEAKQHLEGCEACRAFARDSQQLIAHAALPQVSATEKAALSSLPSKVQAQWKSKHQRSSVVRRFAGLALAACFGAAVASAALVPNLAHSTAASHTDNGPSWEVPAPELPASDSQDDELDFEVSWPSTDVN